MIINEAIAEELRRLIKKNWRKGWFDDIANAIIPGMSIDAYLDVCINANFTHSNYNLLHVACFYGNIDLIENILDCGANTSIPVRNIVEVENDFHSYKIFSEVENCPETGDTALAIFWRYIDKNYRDYMDGKEGGFERIAGILLRMINQGASLFESVQGGVPFVYCVMDFCHKKKNERYGPAFFQFREELKKFLMNCNINRYDVEYEYAGTNMLCVEGFKYDGDMELFKHLLFKCKRFSLSDFGIHKSLWYMKEHGKANVLINTILDPEFYYMDEVLTVFEEYKMTINNRPMMWEDRCLKHALLLATCAQYSENNGMEVVNAYECVENAFNKAKVFMQHGTQFGKEFTDHYELETVIKNLLKDSMFKKYYDSINFDARKVQTYEDIIIFYGDYLDAVNTKKVVPDKVESEWDGIENDENDYSFSRKQLAEYYGWQGDGRADDFLDNL